MARYTRNEASTVPQINTELEKIEAAIEDSLSRKGDAPNSMSGPLDMNNQRILNIPEPVDSTDPLRKIDGEQYVTAAAASAAEALESEQNAAASATSAAASASSASSDASVAAGLIEDLNAIYLGAFTTGPETDNEGNPLQQGALYYNTITKNLMVFNGTSWVISVSQELADAAAASAAQAEDSAAAALASEQAADTSEQLAEQHKDSALASASSASSSASAASASQSAAATSATNAAASASQASSSASAASASASAAAVSETNASNSESAAATSESNAASSASAALSSEAAASSSATIAAGSATTAVAASAAAEGHSDDALASANAAGVSATNASDSATSAASSASAASASASAASDSEDAALASEQAAALSESNAATSASQSASSATAASASESAAATSEANASASETNAANSATSAASSATAAAGSATSASNSAATALLYLNDTEAARDEVLQYSTAVSKGLVFVGVYDASTGVYPSLPVDVIGNPFWIIETSGTISGTVYQAGDSLIRDVENEEWIKLDTVDQVSSVAGKVGAVVLDRADVGLSNVDNTSDLNKPISTATQSALDGKSNVGHTHAISDVTSLQSTLDGKAAVSHSHVIGDVSGLQTALDGKAAVSHTHSIANVTGLQGALDGKAPLTGGGTSGTWPISVTGNAATISGQANSATITASTGVDANNIVRRDGNGYIYANHINFNTSESENPSISSFITSNGDGWSRKSSLAHVKNQIRGVADGTWYINITGNAATATTASGLPTYYAGGQQTNPQVYFGQGVGLRVAMTGVPNVWCDTLWINGYAGGDVLQMCALHTSRQGQPRMWISHQASNSTSYGSFYEFPTFGYNQGNGGALYAGSFYDSNNTAYFCDPNGRSRLSSIDYGDGGYYFAAGDWGFRHNTPYGWIQFGPANSGTAHIYTDRSSFYFNVDDSYLNGRLILMENRWIGSKYFGSDGAIYGTVFYDANDSGYYLDPASAGTSLNINGEINLPGVIRLRNGGASSTYISEGYGIRLHGRGIQPVQVPNASFGVGVSAAGGDYGIGNIYATGNITAYYSDERLKTKISNIQNPIDKIKTLDGFVYVDNEVAHSHGFNKTEPQLGLSAQQVQAIAPEVVSLAPFDMGGANEDGSIASKSGENYLTVDYARLVPLLVEAIKEQQTQIEALTSEINTLKEMIK